MKYPLIHLLNYLPDSMKSHAIHDADQGWLGVRLNRVLNGLYFHHAIHSVHQG